MLKKVVLVSVVVVGLLLAVIAMQPAAFVIERFALVGAPADVVYGHVAELRAWEAWSPWAKMDPQMKSTYAGPAAGVGASTSWDGPQAGTGRMTITATEPGETIDIRLEFLAPFEATNRARFTFVPAGEDTKVVWRMEGSNGFVGKALSLFMDMDEMVGSDFERGLASMKTVAEADAAQPPS
jgi:hypothetical protein